jgi:hypothetical protein
MHEDQVRQSNQPEYPQERQWQGQSHEALTWDEEQQGDEHKIEEVPKRLNGEVQDIGYLPYMEEIEAQGHGHKQEAEHAGADTADERIEACPRCDPPAEGLSELLDGEKGFPGELY